MELFAFFTAEELAPVFVFGAIVAGTFWVLSAISSRNSHAEERLERIEAMIVGVEKRLWMTVFGVVGVILSQAVQSILQYGPK